MSRQSSDSAARLKKQDADSAKPILLIDHTKPEDSSDDEVRPGVAETEFDSPVSPTKSLDLLSLKRTRGSLREELAKRKWAKYQEDRVAGKQSDRPEKNGKAGEDLSVPTRQTTAESSTRWGESTLQRGRRKALEVKESALGRKTTAAAPKPEGDTAIDVLYENQRGSFFFGIPLFSSRSLLNFDPPAWVDACLKPSAVDITNAQVPDPSWSWDWRTWYVDMSHDVDEEGWEYSFWFQKGSSWHGTHPWFHSFVRRRRWLRKRVRRKHHVARDKAHALNPEYFTIHVSRAKSPGSSLGTSDKRASSAAPSSGRGRKSGLEPEEEVEIRSIPALMDALRKAAIDREKIVYIKTFLDQGGDQLHYLADEIPSIMSLLVFQNSRRQLLSLLMHKFDTATAHREEHQERGEAEDEEEQRYIDNLLSAVNAADEQCKRLEFWSDIRDVVRKGESIGATHYDHGWDHEWAGVDTSGPDPDAVGEINDGEKAPAAEVKGKGKAIEKPTEPTATAPGTWIDGTSEQPPKQDMEDIMSDEEERPGRLSEDLHEDELEEGRGPEDQKSDGKENSDPSQGIDNGNGGDDKTQPDEPSQK